MLNPDASVLPSQPTTARFAYPFSVAPMMDRTDRHCRYFLRQISLRSLLYTEMVTSQAIWYGDRDRLLGFDPAEKPLALQVGGDQPTELAECARIAEAMGYDEINLNVGCPSDRVQSGNFGACLMAQPERVAACVAAMMQATAIPVTVKHRIGIDECDRYEDMANFVRIVADAGCQRFTVHARKAWLQGLSPKDNRTIPPLRYEDVYRLKREFPHLVIEINGGITTLTQAQQHLQQVDAVMMGRAVYDNPYLLARVDREIYGEETPTPSRIEVAERMMVYADAWVRQGGRLNQITRHMLMLFAGQPGARLWRRYLTEQSCQNRAGAEVIQSALTQMSQVTLGVG